MSQPPSSTLLPAGAQGSPKTMMGCSTIQKIWDAQKLMVVRKKTHLKDLDEVKGQFMGRRNISKGVSSFCSRFHEILLMEKLQ